MGGDGKKVSYISAHPRWEDVKDPISLFADDELWDRLPRRRIAGFISDSIRDNLPFPVKNDADGMPLLPDLGALYQINPATKKKRVLNLDRKSYTIFKVYLAYYKNAYPEIDQSILFCTLINISLREMTNDP